MNLVPVEINENQEQVVSGRYLHEFLEVGTEYAKWFSRMCEYGFTEGNDFNSVVFDEVRLEGNREVKRTLQNHIMKLDMAKELCMLARNEKGKQARQYFIQIERDWNSPEKTMARALVLADKKIKQLVTFNAQQSQVINELQPKATYYDLVLQNKTLLSVTKIAKDYGMSAMKLNSLLHDEGIQFKQGDVWLLYQKYADKGYTQSKTQVLDDGRNKFHTYWTQKGRLFVYDLLKQKGILPLIEREQKSA